MELLIAMFSGAVGAVLSQGILRRRMVGALWAVTLLGIVGGFAAYQILALIGPGEKAGPLLLWHLVAGVVGGGLLAFSGAALWARFIG